MEENLKFIALIAAVLLAASVLLTGCMYAIVSGNGTAKPYELDAMPGSEPDIDADDAPTSQTVLQKKFSAMSAIDKENNTITLITDGFLEKYWQSNYEKNSLCSLSTEEILFIIQDTTDLYYYGGYSQIFLPGYEKDSPQYQFPSVEAKAYPGPVEDREVNQMQVQQIIVHRILLLSSPEAVFTGPQIAESVGKGSYNFVPHRICYFPDFAEAFRSSGYSSVSDYRYYILYAFSGCMDTDPPQLPPYFDFSWNGSSYSDYKAFITYYETYGKISVVYPLSTPMYVTLETEAGDAGCKLWLSILNGRFRLYTDADRSGICGRFERVDDRLALTMEDDQGTLILRKEGNRFVCYTEESSMGLTAGTVFCADGMAFWDALLTLNPAD